MVLQLEKDLSSNTVWTSVREANQLQWECRSVSQKPTLYCCTTHLIRTVAPVKVQGPVWHILQAFVVFQGKELGDAKAGQCQEIMRTTPFYCKPQVSSSSIKNVLKWRQPVSRLTESLGDLEAHQSFWDSCHKSVKIAAPQPACFSRMGLL